MYVCMYGWGHFDGPSSSESKEPRFRLLEIEVNAVQSKIRAPRCLEVNKIG